MSAGTPIATRQVLTPTQLANAARELLEHGLPLLWLEGEVSNFTRAKSGHLYFTLKDAGAQIRCAMFRPRAMHVRFAVRDGQQVLVRARVTLYEPRGEFQLQLEHMEEYGLGALQQQFEQLKTRLEAEGLFASIHKKPLPALPKRMAIITSAKGAAVRDVLAVLARRFPLLVVDIFSVLVQGTEAAAQIRDALMAAEKSGLYDVILLTRGGGSLEDLWAFNDEQLAYAIFACKTPVVSAVGHEVDFTIADFVADLRAATPSAAAEIIVPNRTDLSLRLQVLAKRLQATQTRQIERKIQQCDHALLRLRGHHPLRHLILLRQQLGIVAARFTRLRPEQQVLSLRRKTADFQSRMQAALAQQLHQNAQRLSALARTLNAVSPLATLDRGYAIVFDAASQLIKSADCLAIGDEVRVKLAEGGFKAKLSAIKKAPAKQS